MKAKTLTGEIDTDKLSDIDAEIVELIETNALRKAGNERGFAYFLFGHGPKSKKNYCVFQLPNGEEIFAFMNTANSIIRTITKGKYGAQIIKVEDDNNEGEEWKNES